MSYELNILLEEPSDKLMFLYDKEFMAGLEYIVLKGGRGGGKTEEVGRWCITDSFNHGDGTLCTREIQNSIEDSTYRVLLDWIEKMEMGMLFEVTKNRITNTVTGAWFIFKGMQQGSSRDTIKSIKGIRNVWYEEAQGATRTSLVKLDPTVRMPGRKLIFTMNPDDENDAVKEVIEVKPRCHVVEINYYDNPWCPQVLLDQANFAKKYNPAEYNHVWLGQPRLQGERQTVLPLNLLRLCIDAHKTLGHTDGHAYAGLDLAPGEGARNDKNALCIRKAPVVKEAKDWRSGDLDDIATKIITYGLRWGIIRLFFDAVGCGGFAEKTLKKRKPEFSCVPFMGGAKVFGGDYPFIRAKSYTILNKDFFKNAKSQQWWNLRLRMENTIKMLNGEPVRDPTYYLSFDSETIEDLDGLLQELAQATYKEDASGHVVIDKAPGDTEVEIDGKVEKRRSPNRGDTVGYAFVRDFQLRGLRAY